MGYFRHCGMVELVIKEAKGYIKNNLDANVEIVDRYYNYVRV